MPRSKIFLWLLLAFIAGVGVRSLIPIHVAVTLIAILAASILLVIGIRPRHSGRFLFYGGVAIMVFLGVLRFDLAEYLKPDISSLIGEPIVFRGVVLEDPIFTEKSQRFVFEVENFDAEVRVVTRRHPEYQLGDELKIEGMLEESGEFVFPDIKKTGGGKGNKIGVLLSRLKHAFEDKIDQALPEPHSAFLKGLLLGERSSLPADLVEDFRRTGTSHIVALSGYNITLVGRVFMEFLLWLTLPFVAAFWIAVSGIIFFILLAGASASLIRAGIMGILVLTAGKIGRSYYATNALVFAAALMVLHDPQILRFDAAFQLSFLATAGLMYLSPHMERWLDALYSRLSFDRVKLSLARHGEKSKLYQILIETLSAQLAVLPLLIYLFGRVSLISPLANVLVLVAVPYSMATGFIAGLLGFLWEPLSRVFGVMSWILLEYKIQIIELVARVPGAYLTLGRLSIIPVVILYGFIFFYLWKRSKNISG